MKIRSLSPNLAWESIDLFAKKTQMEKELKIFTGWA